MTGRVVVIVYLKDLKVLRSKKNTSKELPPDTMIDVELVKKMTYSEYKSYYNSYKKKGWRIQGYQSGTKIK
jgi:hypothetical protein